METQSPTHKGGGAPSPIFGPFLLWPNGWMHQDATWYGGRPQPRELFVRWGRSRPFLKRRRSPKFSAHDYCSQKAGWMKVALGMEVGVGPVHIVLDGDTAPLSKRGQSPPQVSVHLYRGQTAGCIKMPLGMEVGLSPCDFVLDGDPAPYPGGSPTQLSPHIYCGQTAAWIKMPVGMEIGLA